MIGLKANQKPRPQAGSAIFFLRTPQQKTGLTIIDLQAESGATMQNNAKKSAYKKILTGCNLKEISITPKLNPKQFLHRVMLKHSPASRWLNAVTQSGLYFVVELHWKPFVRAKPRATLHPASKIDAHGLACNHTACCDSPLRNYQPAH